MCGGGVLPNSEEGKKQEKTKKKHPHPSRYHKSIPRFNSRAELNAIL